MKLLWMFDYDALWALSPLCGALWSLGGAGLKPLRRFLLPAILGLSAWSMGTVWWGWVFSALFLGGASTLPYGDKSEEALDKIGFKWLYWAFVYAVGCSYGLSLLPLFFAQKSGFLAVLSPFITGSTFALGMSLSKGRYQLPWKVVEIAVGMVLGGLVAYALYPR